MISQSKTQLPKVFRFGSQPLEYQAPEIIENIGDQHKLTRIELQNGGVRQQSGTLDGNLERLDPLLRVPGFDQLLVELLDSLHILLLRQVQHVMHGGLVVVVQLLEAMAHLVGDRGLLGAQQFTAGQEAGDDRQLLGCGELGEDRRATRRPQDVGLFVDGGG